MKLLVTGGAGFIGSNFIRYMLGKYTDCVIVNLDKLTYAGNPDNLIDVAKDDRYGFVKADICDAGVVDSAMKGIDVVVNFAAETHVDRSIGKPEDFIMTDVYGTYILLESAKKYGVRKFVQISTDEVYGEAESPSGESRPSVETDALKPKSPYAASKAGADRLVFSYWATYGMPVVITRCSNNFGPYQYPEKMIPLFVTNVLEGKKMPVYGDGKNTRDWIHVADHCKAIDLLIHREGNDGEVFNIGGGDERSILEIADIILSVLGKPKDCMEFVKDRPGHVKRHAVDTGKIGRIAGWKPEKDFRQGMEETVIWYRDNVWWWKKIKSGEYKEYYKKNYLNR